MSVYQVWVAVAGALKRPGLTDRTLGSGSSAVFSTTATFSSTATF